MDAADGLEKVEAVVGSALAAGAVGLGRAGVATFAGSVAEASVERDGVLDVAHVERDDGPVVAAVDREDAQLAALREGVVEREAAESVLLWNLVEEGDLLASVVELFERERVRADDVVEDGRACTMVFEYLLTIVGGEVLEDVVEDVCTARGSSWARLCWPMASKALQSTSWCSRWSDVME